MTSRVNIGQKLPMWLSVVLAVLYGAKEEAEKAQPKARVRAPKVVAQVETFPPVDIFDDGTEKPHNPLLEQPSPKKRPARASRAKPKTPN